MIASLEVKSGPWPREREREREGEREGEREREMEKSTTGFRNPISPKCV